MPGVSKFILCPAVSDDSPAAKGLQPAPYVVTFGGLGNVLRGRRESRRIPLPLSSVPCVCRWLPAAADRRWRLNASSWNLPATTLIAFLVQEAINQVAGGRWKLRSIEHRSRSLFPPSVWRCYARQSISPFEEEIDSSRLQERDCDRMLIRRFFLVTSRLGHCSPFKREQCRT